jgi:hypothetical protein
MLAVLTIPAAAGHRTASRFAKKVVRHCAFSEKFGILEKHHISNDATENAWFLSNLTSARK